MNENVKEILANRLLSLREESELPRQKVADDLGISRNSLEYYEKGKRTPDVGMIVRLAEYYGVTVDYLFGLNNVASVDPSMVSCSMFTGLSEKAINNIRDCESHIINPILESYEFYRIVWLIGDAIFNKDLYHIDSTIPLDSISDSKLYQLIYAINESHGLLPLYKQQLNELIDSMLDSIIELNIAKPTITNSDGPSEDEE